MARRIILIVVFGGVFITAFSQILERKKMFGSVNLGTGPPYGLIGLTTEVGFSRYGVNFGFGMAQYYPFIATGGMNYYFYPVRQIHQIRARTGLHFGTIEHETKKALWPFFSLGMEYWFRNYATFNLDLNMPFKEGFYAVSPSLGIGYNLTTKIQNPQKNKKSEQESDKEGKRKAPKATF